ncbi:MAG: hypothetical protein KAH05_02410 [Clostridiales bacterium]|nr:hypothetical protein [Clostridiales bacterium]
MIDYLPSLVLFIPIILGAVMLYILIGLLNLLRKINTKLDILINNK